MESLPIERRYLTWLEGLEAKLNGGLEQIHALSIAAESVTTSTSYKDNIITFYENARTLASTELEPPKNEGGFYKSFDKATGSSHPLTVRITLFGGNLNLGELVRNIKLLQAELERNKKTLPHLDLFEQVVGIKLTPELSTPSKG